MDLKPMRNVFEMPVVGGISRRIRVTVEVL
jgi:hypothetical protein